MILLEDAIAVLQTQGDAEKAAEMAKYHKAKRVYFGVPNPAIDDAVKTWRAELSIEDRLSLASELWNSNVHEARIAAAKLLVQARIPADEEAWALITSWVPQCDALAIADQVCSAGARRLLADPARLDELESWTTSEHMWTRRAALVMTLPWTKMNNPKADDLAARERILGWAEAYAADSAQYIQKSLAEWLRELGKHDAPRVHAFLAQHGDGMNAYARKDASRKLPPL